MKHQAQNRLLYEIDVTDEGKKNQLIVSGTVRAIAGQLPEMLEDARFSYIAEENMLRFAGKVPYQTIDFIPQGLYINWEFYPRPMDLSIPCDFRVRLISHRRTALATGRLANGWFMESNVQRFALVLSDDFDYLADHDEFTQLYCLYYQQNPALARAVLAQAKADLKACRDLFGFFPYHAIIFVPGSTRWSGGCPLATGVLGLHHRPEDSVLMGNNSIITHEICHEYWGEYIKDAEMTGWLGIGLGLATDLELCQDSSLHTQDKTMYRKACQVGERTAIDLPCEEFQDLMKMENLNEYDYNSAVIHGKSGIIMEKIQQAVGKAAFFDALTFLLREYAGQAIDRRHFLTAIQRFSGQDFSRQLADWLANDACII